MWIDRSGGPGTKPVIRCGTNPQILEKAEETAQSAMTEGFVKRLKACAREDAKRGVYMSASSNLMRKEQMREQVSPDRSGPMAQVNCAIQQALSETDPLLRLLDRLLEKLSGNCSAGIHIRPEGQTAEIRASNGEVIASYSSLGGGWTEIQTKAEKKFYSESTAVYYQAYKEARAEMKAARAESSQGGEAAVDVWA